MLMGRQGPPAAQELKSAGRSGKQTLEDEALVMLARAHPSFATPDHILEHTVGCCRDVRPLTLRPSPTEVNVITGCAILAPFESRAQGIDYLGRVPTGGSSKLGIA